MKKIKLTAIILSLLVVLSLLIVLVIHKKQNVIKPDSYKLPEGLVTLNSNTVSENERYQLRWNNENEAVTVLDKNSGKVWGTTPNEFLENPTSEDSYVNNGLRSGITAVYYSEEKKSEGEVNSYSDAEYITAGKIKNGLRVTYFFDSLQFSIPVLFTLEEDGVSVSLEIENIKEGNQNKVVSVSLTPFLASCKNNTDSYIFVPSGCGALMVPDDTRSPRYYDEAVYGNDLSSQSIYQNMVTKNVLLPVFGVKDRGAGAFAVVTSGAEFSHIKAVVGDPQYGFSGVYCSFSVRDKSVSYLKTSEGTNNEVFKYTEGFPILKRASVRYFFSDSDYADYNGMASIYKDYLNKSTSFERKHDDPDIFVNILGGYYQKESFLGIPYQTLTSLTTCSQARNILSNIKEKTGATFVANLKGFTESGLDYGKFGGNFKIAGILGGNKDFKKLSDWLGKNDTLSVDFDLLHFSVNGQGFSVGKSATNVNGVRATVYDYNIHTHSQNTSGRKSFLVNREQLAKSSKMITDKISDLGLRTVAFSSLSGEAYSDHWNQNYYGRAHMSDDAIRILTATRKKGIQTVGTVSNAYAAAYQDYIFATPSSSSQYYALDCEIPFYQMIFKGRTALSSEPINLAIEARTEFLKAISTGSSLCFTICDHTSDRLYSSVHSAAAAGVYKDISSDMFRYIEEAKPFLTLVNGAEIKSFTREGEITKTVFNNGTMVYVNFGDTPIQTEFGVVESGSFLYR